MRWVSWSGGDSIQGGKEGLKEELTAREGFEEEVIFQLSPEGEKAVRGN